MKHSVLAAVLSVVALVVGPASAATFKLDVVTSFSELVVPDATASGSSTTTELRVSDLSSVSSPLPLNQVVGYGSMVFEAARVPGPQTIVDTSASISNISGCTGTLSFFCTRARLVTADLATATFAAYDGSTSYDLNALQLVWQNDSGFLGVVDGVSYSSPIGLILNADVQALTLSEVPLPASSAMLFGAIGLLGMTAAIRRRNQLK